MESESFWLKVIAYLDTNFFNWLADQSVAAVSIAFARNRRFNAPVSLTVLAEILATPDGVRRRKLLGLAFDVCDKASVLKPVHELLIDEIKASFAAERSNPFLPSDSGQKLLSYYSRLLLDEGARARERADIEQRTQSWKSAFGSFHDALRTIDPDFTRKTIAPSFQEHFAGLAPAFAKDWACRAGIPDGFEPSVLLNNRPVRVGIRYALACDWDHKYGPRDDRPVEASDARDLQHAILAAAACDVLVVCDRIFKSRLERVRVEHLQILDFGEFVARVL